MKKHSKFLKLQAHLRQAYRITEHYKDGSTTTKKYQERGKHDPKKLRIDYAKSHDAGHDSDSVSA